MQIKDVYELLERFEKSSLNELSLEMEGICFHCKKGCGQESVYTESKTPVINNTAFAVRETQTSVSAQENTQEDEKRVVVTAQIAGTFYRAPSPEAEPYVKVGQQVKKGDTLGLMEAMKMMSNVVAPVDGEIKEIPAENATLVSFGAPLFYIG